MTRAFSLFLISATLCALPHVASAQDGEIRPYLNVGIEVIDVDSFDGPNSVDFFPEVTFTAVLRGGLIVHEYFAVEGEAAIGFDNQDGDGIAGYDNRFAGYGRARYPFGESGFEVFARLGYATTNIDSVNVIGDGSLDGISYGAGVAYSFGREDQFQLRGDFTQFEFGNDQNSSGFAFAIGYNF